MSENGAHIVVLSAKNQDRLKAIAQQQLDYVNKQQELSLQDYAYTLQTGREEMEDRLALVVRSKEELVIGLQACLAEKGDKLKSSVPVFSGNAENGSSDLEALLDGPLREMVIETLLSENNLEKDRVLLDKRGANPMGKALSRKRCPQNTVANLSI